MDVHIFLSLIPALAHIFWLVLKRSLDKEAKKSRDRRGKEDTRYSRNMILLMSRYLYIMMINEMRVGTKERREK
jgi:uncharacterized membrane protein YjjP (DUF1212 family)